MPATQERRLSTRFPVQAPVLFSWTEHGELQRGAGFTRDMCARGAYICNQDSCQVEIEDKVTLQVLLPRPHTGGIGPRRLQGTGHVVRRGGVDEDAGFAVLVEFGLL